MKKKYRLIISLLLAAYNHQCLLSIDLTSSIPIKKRTFLVSRRYYFIYRLQKTIRLLAKMYQEVNNMQGILAGRKVNFQEILPDHECKTLQHTIIKRSIKRIYKTRSLKPLFMVWDSFASYKSLQDDLFVEDFSKEIFIITRNTICHMNKYNQYKLLKDECMSLNWIDVPVHECLEAISIMTHHLSTIDEQQHNTPVYRPEHTTDISDLKLRINPNEVAFRYYCLHRLGKAMHLLLSSDNEPLLSARYQELLFDTKRSQQKTLQQLWDDIKQYKYIDDDAFLRDFLIHIYVLLYQRYNNNQSNRALSYTDVLSIHQQIEKMPIEELLNSIDIIVGQVSSVVHHYQSSGLTFTQWIKKYWWVPPILFSTVLIKCIKFYYKKMYP